ncbi:chorismate-binding protein [Reichenbachiella ulvae]|uniref:Chorismate-binding protein n=1 Tax=Reichenbachiella ulvae TaxID=2980104 RepID=A0ABT3CS60_9BACT|nr:chorismate-binding protein [Reichenbachiella ulvae]MCV9386452.1 chorismate-binding protein [Reichenbachiella ulvae]
MNKELEKINQTLEGKSFEEKLKAFFHTAVAINTPVAIWRKPQEEKIQATCQVTEGLDFVEEIESASTGFLFNCFKSNQQGNFIRSEINLDQESENLSISPKLESSDRLNHFFNQFAQFQEDPTEFNFQEQLKAAPHVLDDKQAFIQLVEKCKTHIEEGYYQKIVPSRRSRYQLPKGFHPVHELMKLCKSYENAFVSLVYTPEHGLWLGATPELLIETENDQYFRTVSLAGTQGIPKNFNLSQAAWTQKEIEEQALVSRYIINCFKQIRLREFSEHGPKTVKAGNLIHLKTSFEVDMKATNFPELATVMLKLLHPTSAVCGMPMKPAAQFLEQHEGYDRSFFSGYLGPVNDKGTTSVFVNLRCTQIFKDGGIIFAGAGVTEDSIPELEWNETEIKFRTLLNVFENI